LTLSAAGIIKDASQEDLAMADAEVSGQRDRSPAYPVVPLETALTRLGEFEAHFKRVPARPEKIGEAWGIEAKAYADRIAAALRYFGLLEYQGNSVPGGPKYVIVSDEGRKYLRAQQPDVRHEIVRAAALRPKQIAKFWGEWGSDRPADPAAIDQLALESGFSDAGARQFLKVYDATIAFAGLTESDKMAGVDQEANEAPMTTAQATTIPQRASPSSIARDLLDESPESVQYPKAKSPMLQETFYLDEGPVTLSFPRDLSQDSYGDLKDQLELFLRRAQRRARRNTAPDDNGETSA
jgi:hypothetical protein